MTTTTVMSAKEPPPPQDGSSPREDPATVRRTFLWMSLAATLILLPPRQWVSAGIMAAVTLGLYLWHWRKLSRESAKPRAPVATREAVAIEDGPSAPEASTAEVGDREDAAPVAAEAPAETDERSDAAPDSGQKDGSDRAG